MNLRAIFLKMGFKIRKSPSKYITRWGAVTAGELRSPVVTAGGRKTKQLPEVVAEAAKRVSARDQSFLARILSVISRYG